MTERFVEFCADGILRVSVGNSMLPATSLCDPGYGVPWWMTSLPARVGTSVSLRALMECLLPWENDFLESSGLDVTSWMDVVASRIDTPRIGLRMERRAELGRRPTWTCQLEGPSGTDYGDPCDVTPDVLGAAHVSLSHRILLTADPDGDGPPLLDGGHRDAFVLGARGMPSPIAVWVDADAASFTDFINQALLPLALTTRNPVVFARPTPAFGAS